MGRAATAPSEHTPTASNTPPLWHPCGGVAETRKAPSNEGASLILGTGQKRAPSVVSENAQGGQSRRSLASAPAPRMKTSITTAENTTAPRQRYRPRGSLEIAPYTTPIIISSLYTCELKTCKIG